MALETTAESPAPSLLATGEAYGIALICLLMGMVLGYLIPESRTHSSAPRVVTSAPKLPAPPTSPGVMPGSVHVPTLEEMKHMADKQAEPLLNKVKSDPKDSDAFAQLGAIYHKTHQFTQAVTFYRKAVDLNPKDLALRNKFASSLYRVGDVDGAIAQLDQALAYEPHDANSLFNLGMIRLQGKKDGKGAIAAWQRLLKTNPQLSADRKAEVQKLMAEVLTSLGNQAAVEGVRPHDGPRSR